MKVLIVAKTRRGAGACVGGITGEGRSVRLVAANTADERAGLEYEVGEVWEIDSLPDPHIVPPHIENIIVLEARKLRRSDKLEATIRRFMPPRSGGPEVLFDGLARSTPSGGLYVADSTGLPHCSTMFWIPDQPLQLDCDGKRLRYRYPNPEPGCTLTFVGFQDPRPLIAAGTLLRVSLAHHWRPPDQPNEEPRCFVQLSGWFLDPAWKAVAEPQSAKLAADCSSTSEKPVNSEPRLEQAREVLLRVFGFSRFLPLQGEVIARVLERRDSLVVMPTGGGKSLCYQLPALLLDGLTVVVSPLIALMQDQVRQLHELDIPAACLNHTVQLREWTAVTSRIRQANIRMLYLAPETLVRPEILLLLEQSRLACLAVDEAHCISEWGHDFRPEYRQLCGVRRRFPRAACLALTATATPRVREDIRRLMNIPVEGEFVASFNRPNLFLAAEQRLDSLAQIQAFLQRHRGESGIIYCGTRNQVDELCAGLTANGWPALPYHAGLEDKLRRRNQNLFINDDGPLLVATIAFGMGINKPNIRFVIHAHLPKGLEAYYQEIGRAGRDGLPAACLLLHSRSDAIVHRHFIDEGAASERAGRQARLDELIRFAEARECRRGPLLAYFGEKLPHPCGHCDNCVPKPETGKLVDVSIQARNFLSCVRFTGEVFGGAHIIAVLRGSKSKRVLTRRHDRLALYGQGREHSEQYWRELAQQLLRQALCEQDMEFGGFQLTAKGREVLTGTTPVLVHLESATEQPQSAMSPEPMQHDSALFQKLRSLRRELADAAQLPAYFIFADRTLAEMAARRPQTETQLLTIHGVGQAKLARYAPQFLQLIRDHVANDPPSLSSGAK